MWYLLDVYYFAFLASYYLGVGERGKRKEEVVNIFTFKECDELFFNPTINSETKNLRDFATSNPCSFETLKL